MKTWYRMIVALAVVVAAAGYAADGENAETVTITGQSVNLLKALGGEKDLEADATYGGLNALKVKEVLGADGKALEGFSGKLVHFLPVAAASELLSGDVNAGKVLTVKGVLYKDAMTLSVTEFTVADAPAAGVDGDDYWEETDTTNMSRQAII